MDGAWNYISPKEKPMTMHPTRLFWAMLADLWTTYEVFRQTSWQKVAGQIGR